MHIRNVWTIVIIGTAGLVGGPAHAIDGVKGIKQPRSFPYLIALPGSYRLVGNITVPDADTTAIKIATDNVKLDLNGFTIKGVNTCTTSGCTTIGNGIGIDGQGHVGISIVDGTVQGMGNRGILLDGGRVERVRAVDNGDDGVAIVGSIEGGHIERVSASHNGFNGIQLGTGVIANCVVTNNGASGIYLGVGGVATNNYVEGNTWSGIEAGSEGATVVIGNAASVNQGSGISAGDGATVVGNAAVGNDTGIVVGWTTVAQNTAVGNTDTGIAANGVLVANTASGNAFGIEAGIGGYAHNVTRNNSSNDMFGGTEIGGNLCGSDMTCP